MRNKSMSSGISSSSSGEANGDIALTSTSHGGDDRRQGSTSASGSRSSLPGASVDSSMHSYSEAEASSPRTHDGNGNGYNPNVSDNSEDSNHHHYQQLASGGSIRSSHKPADGVSESRRSIGEDSYDASVETNSMFSQLQSADSRPSRVQILESSRQKYSHKSGVDSADNESLASKATGSIKRRSNSNFTVPSISKTSITTMSDAGSTHTIPSSLLPFHQQQLLETASIITIASSSKQNNRRSFDTNASTMALAPESILSRNGSIDSYAHQPAKSIASSRKVSDGEVESIEGS